MKTLMTTLILFFSSVALMAQSTDSKVLTLNFEITKHDKGQILFALYNSSESHMDDTFKTAKAKVENGKAKISVKIIQPGFYSFSYFHDLNSNDELDTNLVGVPKEPYGFSNGEKGRLGPPDFEDCKIKINDDTNIQISIK